MYIYTTNITESNHSLESFSFMSKNDAFEYLNDTADSWVEFIRTHYATTSNEYLVHLYADSSPLADGENSLLDSVGINDIDPNMIHKSFEFDITISTETGDEVFNGSLDRSYLIVDKM